MKGMRSLPEMERRARELVNEGRYGLYVAHEPPNPDWAYYLMTRSEIYALKADGAAAAIIRANEIPNVHLGEPVWKVVR